MAVETLCKLCNKTQNPYINPKTDEVFCGACDKKINVDHFVKIQLKILKQYREQKKVPFGVKCPTCGKEDTPKDTGDDIICGACNSPLTNLTEYFKRMLKMQLKKVNKDV